MADWSLKGLEETRLLLHIKKSLHIKDEDQIGPKMWIFNKSVYAFKKYVISAVLISAFSEIFIEAKNSLKGKIETLLDLKPTPDFWWKSLMSQKLDFESLLE